MYLLANFAYAVSQYIRINNQIHLNVKHVELTLCTYIHIYLTVFCRVLVEVIARMPRFEHLYTTRSIGAGCRVQEHG